MATKLKVTIGSGNVFRDIGFPEGEAENLLLRSELMSLVREVARVYTQQEAAKMLGITAFFPALCRIDIDGNRIFITHQMGDPRYASDCTIAGPSGVVAPPFRGRPCRVVAPSPTPRQSHTRMRSTAVSRLNHR